jgi:hypothetical protein
MLPPPGRLRSASRATTYGSRSTTRGSHRVAGDDARHCNLDHARQRRRHRARVRDVSTAHGVVRSFGIARRLTPAHPHNCTARPPVATPYRRPPYGTAPTVGSFPRFYNWRLPGILGMSGFALGQLTPLPPLRELVLHLN